MKKTLKKLIILLVIFMLALIAYYLISQKKNSNDVAYTAIEDANLPVVYMQLFNKKMNCLYGYLEDNSAAAGRTVLTVLPEDRQLTVNFSDVSANADGIQYEIRSLDGERLIERTALEEWVQEGETVTAVLPIQNLLTKEEEYNMTLAIAVSGQPAVYYHTRIVWTDHVYVQDMINLAEEFSSKTMNYEAARDLTTYLETDAAADNSSLGRVSLRNSFSQLTWRGMDMEREGEILVSLKELQGIMGTIQLNYVASRTEADSSKEYFDVTETFTMKWNAQRIYMMDYDRRVNQVFSGEQSVYTDNRIMLGISDGEELQQVSDASGRYKAFVVNKALWCYDTKEKSSTKAFAFRKSENDLRSNFDNHGVKILSVSETGGIDFLVYGYMNRGNHEGSVGVAVYHYESTDNTLTERMYMPAEEDYWNLRQDINTLSYLSDTQVLYLLMNHTVYGVDLASKEYMVVADGLTEENFAVSGDSSRIAWQEGKDIYGSSRLHIMDMKTGNKKDIKSPEGKSIRLLGCVGQDIVYGLFGQDERLRANGRVVGVPMNALEIIDENMAVKTRYEKPDTFITDVKIQDSRVHLMRMVKAEGGYIKTEPDTLVCNKQVTPDLLAGMGYLAAEIPGRQYFVQLDAANKTTQPVKLYVPKKVVAEENNVLMLRSNELLQINSYYSYSEGRMNGAFASFERAVQAAHDGMGLVTNQNGAVLWVRVNKSPSKTIKDVQSYVPVINRYLEELAEGKTVAADGAEIIDARGCTLNQVLYFVHTGSPVAAYTGSGYMLIYGYDAYNIYCLWNPGTEAAYTDKVGLNDAAAYFEANGENDFISFQLGK